MPRIRNFSPINRPRIVIATTACAALAFAATASAQNDIVLKAMAPEIGARYQRPSDLLGDILALGRDASSRRPGQVLAAEPAAASVGSHMQDIHTRLRAREAPQPRFCWHCRKPLHARSDTCPFCGEAQ